MRIRPTRCRSCRAEIVFLDKPNKLGKMPVDWDSIEDEPTLCGENTLFDHALHRSHHATCPDAEERRKRYAGRRGSR